MERARGGTHRLASNVTQHASASLGHVCNATPSTKSLEWALRSLSWARPTWHCKAAVLVMQARASKSCPMARYVQSGFVACVACRGSDGFVRWAARQQGTDDGLPLGETFSPVPARLLRGAGSRAGEVSQAREASVRLLVSYTAS